MEALNRDIFILLLIENFNFASSSDLLMRQNGQKKNEKYNVVIYVARSGA